MAMERTTKGIEIKNIKKFTRTTIRAFTVFTKPIYKIMLKYKISLTSKGLG